MDPITLAIGAGTSLLGGLFGAQSNVKAAKTANAATREAAQIQANSQRETAQMQLDAAQRAREWQLGLAQQGIGAINDGMGRARSIITPLTVDTPSETIDTQHVDAQVYNPDLPRGLTAAQTIARNDIIRNGQATLAASGLRGAGRSGVAAVMDTDRRFMANAADTNDAARREAARLNVTLRTNADAANANFANDAQKFNIGQANTRRSARQSAALQLAGLESNQGSNTANILTGVGTQGANGIISTANNIANDQQTTTSNIAQGIRDIGTTTAQSGLANSQLMGNAIGTIGATAGQLYQGWASAPQRSKQGVMI